MLHKITFVQHNAQPLFRPLLRLNRCLFYLRQCLRQLFLGIPPLRMKRDALHQYRLFLAMIKSRKPQHTTLIHAHGVSVKLLHQLLLYPAKAFHLPAFHKPIGMQGFPCSDDHGRQQRKSINLRLLLLKRQLIALHKLRIDTGNQAVLLPAIIHHKENPSIQCIMLLKRLFQGSIFPTLYRILLAGENPRLPIIEDTKTYRIIGIKQAVQNILCLNIHQIPPLASITYSSSSSILPKVGPADASAISGRSKAGKGCGSIHALINATASGNLSFGIMKVSSS